MTSDDPSAAQPASADPATGEPPAAPAEFGPVHERELKFVLPEASVRHMAARLAALEGSVRRGRATRLVSVYFDTPARGLQAAGVSFRIRRRGHGRVQTIKKNDGGAGFFDRLELERAVRSDEPSLTHEESAALAAMLGGPLLPDRPLAPVFVATVKRTLFDVTRGEAAIEVALDEAVVAAGDRSAAFHELELELKAGPPETLFSLAREIFGEAPLRLGVMSKSARGYALLEDKERRSYKEQGSPITRLMDAEAAFQAVVADCVSQYRLNEDLLLDRPQAKAVHRARVGLRRLRSAFTLFKTLIVDDRTDALASELKWLAGALGGARDLDVFLDRLPEAPDGGASRLAGRVETRRDAAYREAMEAIGSRRAVALMLDLAEWTAVGAWRSNPETASARAAPVVGLAADILDKRLKKLKKAGRDLARLSPEDRHRARIEAKKLRYACGFFGALYSTEPRRDAFMALMADLQDELGALNDIATARTLTAELAREAGSERDGEAAFSAGLLAGEAQAGADRLVARAGKKLYRLLSAKPFWRQAGTG
jgi:triphosphatase